MCTLYNVCVCVCECIYTCMYMYIHVCTVLMFLFLVCVQEWALGLLHTKCICGAIWLTNIQFKQTLDQVLHYTTTCTLYMYMCMCDVYTCTCIHNTLLIILPCVHVHVHVLWYVGVPSWSAKLEPHVHIQACGVASHCHPLSLDCTTLHRIHRPTTPHRYIVYNVHVVYMHVYYTLLLCTHTFCHVHVYACTCIYMYMYMYICTCTS